MRKTTFLAFLQKQRTMSCLATKAIGTELEVSNITYKAIKKERWCDEELNKVVAREWSSKAKEWRSNKTKTLPSQIETIQSGDIYEKEKGSQEPGTDLVLSARPRCSIIYNNSTERQYQKRPLTLWPWWVKAKIRPPTLISEQRQNHESSPDHKYYPASHPG